MFLIHKLSGLKLAPEIWKSKYTEIKCNMSGKCSPEWNTQRRGTLEGVEHSEWNTLGSGTLGGLEHSGEWNTWGRGTLGV